MLRSVRHLNGFKINASDDQIGHVEEIYFDDDAWTIRYLVVDTGNWLVGRKVLISPYAIKTPISDGRTIQVTLTRDQVEKSPDIDTHKPVSRQHERDYLSYYGYPSYWGMGGVWGASDYPLFPYVADLKGQARRAEADNSPPLPADAPNASPDAGEDSHLRSTADIRGYDIQAEDGSIGHVEDFIFDEESWTIRYFVINTGNWWPGKKVLVATHWIDRIDRKQRKVYAALTRDAIKNSPEYDDDAPLDRQYEERLHKAHERGGYWE